MNFRIVRRAQASWQGDLTNGSGRIALDSGAFAGPYSPAGDLRTTAQVTLAARGGGFDIVQIALTTVGEVPGIAAARFADLASQAKNCTISRALTGTEITLKANLTVG